MNRPSLVAAVQGRIRAIASPARFGRFISVGVVGAICDNTVLLATSELGLAAWAATALGIPGAAPEVAKAAGIETAIVVMFFLNERWTFALEGAAGVVPFLRRLGTSHLVRAGGVTVQLIVFSLVYRRLFVSLSVAGLDLWLLVASGVGIAMGMIVNFVFESLITWRVYDPG